MNLEEARVALTAIHETFHRGRIADCSDCDTLIEGLTPDAAIMDGSPPYKDGMSMMGRPPMPDLIDATPEEIARKVMNTPPPKGGWQYMRRKDG